jgi:hypothetical protein
MAYRLSAGGAHTNRRALENGVSKAQICCGSFQKHDIHSAHLDISTLLQTYCETVP